MSDFEDASLILTPNAYKAGKAYCVKPIDGSGDFTVVRNTSATRVDENGLIESVGANVPRLNYPIGGGCPSWLIEPQATNLLQYSEEFDNAAWSSSLLLAFGAGSVANAAVAPDGTTSADLIVPTTDSSNTHYIRTTTQPALATGVSGTFSVFVKAAGYTTLSLRLVHTDAPIINYDTVAISADSASGTITPVGNGWFRCTITGVGTGTNAWPWIYPNQQATYAGDGTSGIYIWGAQLEQGSYPTSYIPTTGTTVTRNGDVTTVAPPSGTTEIVETLKDITYYIGGNNLLTYSEEFDNAVWVNLRTTPTANSILSPDGNITADLITVGFGTNTKYTGQLYTSTVGRVFSCFVKSGTQKFIQLLETTNNQAYANFDIETGVAGNTGSLTTSSIEDVGGGWFRVSCYFDLTTSSAVRIYFADSNTATYGATTANQLTTLYLWGAQVEEGSLTDYQATRDIITVPTTYQLPNGEIKKVIMT